MSSNIILIGPPGAGKSCVARAVAALLNWQLIDTDCLLESKLNMTIWQIFQNLGETSFRQEEQQILKDLLVMFSQKPSVIATGGGMPAFFNNYELLEQLGQIVLLQAELDTLAKRAMSTPNRPLLNTCQAKDFFGQQNSLKEKLTNILIKRASVYNRPQYKIDTTLKTVQEVAQEIMSLLVIS